MTVVLQRQSIFILGPASPRDALRRRAPTNPSPSSWRRGLDFGTGGVPSVAFSLLLLFPYPTVDEESGSKRLPHLAHRFARLQCDVSSLQRGLTQGPSDGGDREERGRGYITAYQTEHFSRETYPDLGRAAAAEKEEMSRGAKGFPARVPWVHGSWRRRMTGAIAEGYCAPPWDFTVEAAATPRRSRSSLVPCGQKFDSERWRLLTGFRPAGCAVSTANGREFRSAPGWYRPSEEGFPRRGRVRAGPRFGPLRFPF